MLAFPTKARCWYLLVESGLAVLPERGVKLGGLTSKPNVFVLSKLKVAEKGGGDKRKNEMNAVALRRTGVPFLFLDRLTFPIRHCRYHI